MNFQTYPTSPCSGVRVHWQKRLDPYSEGKLGLVTVTLELPRVREEPQFGVVGFVGP